MRMEVVIVGGDARFGALARLLAERGDRVWTLGREPSPGIEAADPDALVRAAFDPGARRLFLLDEFCPAMQFEVDVYWVQAGGGEPVEWVKKVGGRMDVVHFKEMAGQLPGEQDHSMTKMAPVGEGNLNWPAIMAACDAIGVKYAFVEQDNAVDTDPLGCMKTSHDNLVRLGARF